MAILDISNVSKSFGGVKANVDISLSVEQGSIVGLIGPNGSGKTTLFNSIVGTYPIDQGSIKFNGAEVSELPVPVVAKLGLLRTFQQTRIYSKLNCIQNMLISRTSSKKKTASRRPFFWTTKIIRISNGFNERTKNAFIR
jgi:neutral amino acid transport system ATP-binding protein